MSYRKPKIFKIQALISIIFFLLIVGFFILPKISFAQNDILKEKCYNPILERYKEIKKEDEGYILGLPLDKATELFEKFEEIMPSSEESSSAKEASAAFSKLEKYLDEAKNDPKVCELRKERNLKIIQLSQELMQCYKKEGIELNQDVISAINSYIKYYTNQIEAVKSFDCQETITTENENVSIIKLAPYETKYIKVRSFCLDGKKDMPSYGDKYEYRGNIDELGRKNLANFLLASIAAPDQRFDLQEAVWNDEEGKTANKEEELIKLAQTGQENREKEINQIKKEAEKSEEKALSEKSKPFNQLFLGITCIAALLFVIALAVLFLKFSKIKKRYLLLIFYILLLIGLLILVFYSGLKIKAASSETGSSMINFGKFDLSKLDISAESEGDYSELDISVKNKTDEWEALDLTKQYFKPTNPKNQRIVISTKKKDTIPLPPLEPLVTPEGLPKLVPIVAP